MKKTLSPSTTVSILTASLVILTCIFGVSTQRSRAAGFYATIRTWLVPTQGKQSPLAGPITVTATAGTTGPTDYATLGAAFTAVNAGTHQGVITMAVVGDTNEGSATATLNASGSGSASYTSIAISPSGGAARTITGATTAGSPMIDFSGADNVTIDGLNTGGNSLTISNTTASATSGTSTIRFIGGATSNTITNSNLQGSVSSSVATNGAIVFFSTDANTANGNDNNTISNNNIGPAGANLPTKAILGNGSTTTTAIGNSGMIIDNNNIFDFFGAAVTSAGVAVNGGCNTWSITNNRFYQTGTRTWTTGAEHNAILLNSTTATSGVQGMTVTGNIIGYSSNTQTGTYTLTGSTGTFRAIRFNGITGGTVSNINSNTIASVSLTGVTSSGTSTSSPFVGMLINNGLVNTNSNTIGSQIATGSLTFSTTTTTSTDVYAIFNFSSDDWTANTNSIGGISVTNAGASGTFILYLVRANTLTTKAFNASSNLVGGTVTNSIQLNATGTSSQVIGMATANAASTWTSNTVRNLTTNIGTGTGTSASVIGLISTTSSTNQTWSQNTVFNLTNTNATAASTVTGLQFSGSTTNVVERNLIYAITAASNSATAEVSGIRVGGGTTTYRNNMIAVGAGTTNAIPVNGINEPSATGTDNFFHNSVYVGGAPTAGSGNSFAFNSLVTTNTRGFRDNIFFNARSNSGATGKNYAVQVGGTAPNPAGLTINNNVYFANGTGAVFGRFNALDVADLSAWKTAVGQDANSFSADPQYLDPANATPNLHINASVSTVVEGNGADVGVTNDFDGQTRASLTPVDIGADAGNFMGVDLSPPAIVYTPLANTTSTSNRTLMSSITDVTGVPTAGAGLPVIYYRKGAVGAFSSTQSSFAGGSTYNFTIDYSFVSGGSVMVGDVIQYYVVAQDSAATPNVGANPSAGASGFTANPPAASTPPTAPNSYTIVAAIAGTKTVGTGGDYATLTGAGGLFADINSKVATSNLVIQIISDLTTEDGTNGLNPLVEEPAGSNFTVKIFPTGATRAISGTNAGALIRLNAADRVTIDGSIGGTGSDRSMSIGNTNTGTSSAVVWMQSNGSDGATNNTIKNLNVAGNSNSTTLIGIGSGSSTISISSTGTSNNSNTIQNNSVSKTQYGVYSGGASAVSKNTGNVITQNAINTASPNNVRTGGILAKFEDGVQITSNTIGGIDQTPTTGTAFGIALGVVPTNTFTAFTGSDVTNAVVSRNFITSVTQLNATGYSAMGIIVNSVTSGTTLVVNNSIAGVISNSTPSDFTAGIVAGGGAGSTTRIFFNSVSMTGDRTAVATSASYALAIAGANPIVDVRDNVLYNTQIASGGGKSFAIGLGYGPAGSANFSNLTSNFNDLFSSGAQSGFARIATLSNTSPTDLANLAAWQDGTTGTGKDASSISSDPMFNSASNLQPQTGSPVIDTGTSLSGLVSPYVDITGATRVDPPSIGAYETPSDTAPPVITYTPLVNTTSTANRMLSSVVVTDGTGVNTAAGTKPRIYYKKSTDANAFAGNTNANNGWKFVETADSASPFSFTIDYSLLTSPVVTGDTIQYFVVAQDTAAPPNVGINSGTFATAPASVNLGAAQAPIGGAINSYLIATPYAGTLNVGTGETITSLTNAGGIFQTINNGVLTGNLTVNITSDLTAETGAVFLNQFAEEGVGGYTLTIKPSGAARTISGTSTGSGLVVLNGADRVTIDGSLSGGTDRSLTITNGNVNGTVIWIASASASNGANNDTVKNCTISGNTGIVPVAGILSGSGVTLGNDAEAPNSNNTIQNNSIFRAQNAMYLRGNGTSLDQNWMVSGNALGSTLATDKLSFRGMLIGNAQAFTISGNTINGVSSSTTSSATMSGIQAALKISGGAVAGNKISDIKQNNTTGWGSNGIYLSASTTASTLTVSNNFITDVASQGFNGVTSSDNGYGVMIDSGGGYSIYHNSVNLATNQVAAGSITAALNIASAVVASNPTELRNDRVSSDRSVANGKPTLPAVGSIDLRDNILIDSQTIGTRYGVYDASTSGAGVFSSIDFNDYLAQNVGFLTSARATLADWQTATGQDASSKSVDPLFISPSDLHLQSTSPVLSMGFAVIATDFDNDPRPATMPDLGADELVQAVAGSIPGGTFYNALTADGDSLGGNVSITNVIYLNGKLSTGANTLSIGCNASLLGGGASNYVIGNLKKTFCSLGTAKTFDVGTANGYSPVSVSLSAATLPADFTVKAVQGAQPNLFDATKALQRYWTLTASGVTADLTFNYLDPTDIPGTANENNFVIFKYNGSFSMPGGSVNTAANTASITGVSSFSDWTLAEPAAEPCPLSTTPTSQNFPLAGGSNSFAVTADGGCNWTPVSNNAFITIDSVTAPSGGGHNGNGTVNYSVSANTGAARMGSITIGVKTFTVTQDGCSYMLDSTSHNFVAPGGSSTVMVTTTAGCGWTAVSNDAFIIVDSGSPGSGNGTVNYHVTANTGPGRMGTMTIAGITFTVTQDAACAFMLSSTSQHFVAAGGMDSVNVITGAGCTWNAVSNDSFIMVTMGSSGTGNGTVNYSVAANAGPARMGTMTIAGITFTVSQDDGCMFTLSRDHQSFAGNGGSGSVNVIASDSACPWMASTAATFIHITSGTPGMGNGTLQYTVDANPGPGIRSNTITIAGQTYTVYQGIDFADVPQNALFYTEIGKLAARGVTLGCGGGNYCPDDLVLRDQMAAFIMRAKGEPNPPTPASQRFNDVPPGNAFYNFIDRMAVLGITLGCSTSPPLYCPSDPVKRDQMAAFIIRGLGEFNPPTPGSQRFTDVPPENPFYKFIDRMAVLQITLGCTPTMYCPSDNVSRRQMAAFLVRAFDL